VGWRRVNVRQHRTAVDWAQELQSLLVKRYAKAEKVILVCDNLNTHKLASLYEAFAPAEARRLAQQVEIHYTPKHGSWLNVAECELSVLSRHCLRGRTGTVAGLRGKVTAWACERNRRRRGVDWQFTTADARIKLKRLYPHVQMSWNTRPLKPRCTKGSSHVSDVRCLTFRWRDKTRCGACTESIIEQRAQRTPSHRTRAASARTAAAGGRNRRSGRVAATCDR